MNRVLSAFNDIADDYITDALEYKKAKPLLSVLNVKRIAAVACVLVLLLSGVGVMLNIWNDVGANVQTPPPVCRVGEKKETRYGTCEYVGYTETTVSFKIQSKEDIYPRFSISAYKLIGENEAQYYIAVLGSSYGLHGLPELEILNDVLVIYVDGVESPTLYIPGDGKEHEVVIDFSYLVDNNYEIRNYVNMEGVGYCVMPLRKNKEEG